MSYYCNRDSPRKTWQRYSNEQSHFKSIHPWAFRVIAHFSLPLTLLTSVVEMSLSKEEKPLVSAKLLAQAPASSLPLSSPCNPSLPAEEPIYADHNLNSSVAPKTASVRPKPDGLLRGQPPFPQILHSSHLSDFVQPRSVIFIKRFCPNADEWIGKNPPWDSIEGFKQDKQIVRSISNTNDAAERLCAVAKRYRVRHIFVVRTDMTDNDASKLVIIMKEFKFRRGL